MAAGYEHSSNTTLAEVGKTLEAMLDGSVQVPGVSGDATFNKPNVDKQTPRWDQTNLRLTWRNQAVLDFRDYGGVGDGVTLQDGAITASAFTLTSATAFVAADVGKTVVVFGAGASGANLQTTIQSVTGGVATLTLAASTTVTGARVYYFTDNAQAFNAWFAASQTFTGGALLKAPAGDYGFAGMPVLPSNITLEGDGPLTVFRQHNASATRPACFTNDLTNGGSNLTLRNFRLDRSGNNVQHGILLNGVAGFRAEGIAITGAPSVTSGALAVSGILPGGSVAVRQLSTDVHIERCSFGQTNNFAVQLSYVLNATVAHNTFTDCYREVIGVEPETGCTARNVAVVGNSLTMSSIPSGGSATGMIVVTTSSGGTIDGVTVSGNTVRNLTATSANTNPGISVLGAVAVSLTGNIISGMNGNGISIGNASFATAGVVVTGNQIRDNNAANSNSGFGGAGISLRQASKCVISGNHIYGFRHTAGIYESQIASKNMIEGNFLDDTVPYVLLAGSRTKAANNLGRQAGSGTRVATATSYTIVSTDRLVAVTDTTLARTITLPAANAVPEGAPFTIKDESGAAVTNNITISRAGTDTIEGAVSLLINVNYGKATLYSDGVSKWLTV